MKARMKVGMLLVMGLYVIFLIGVPLASIGKLSIDKAMTEFAQNVNKAYWGVFHLPSLAFIGGGFLILQIVHVGSGKADSSIKKSFNQVPEITNNLTALFDSLVKQTTNTATYDKIKSLASENGLQGRLLTLLIHGATEDEINKRLNIEFADAVDDHQKHIKHNAMMAGLLPLLGMIGTITGLMFIFSGDDGGGKAMEDAFNNKFAGMGTALLTTLYATLFTAVWFKPRQHALMFEWQRHEKHINKLLITSYLLLHRLDMNLLHHELLQEPLQSPSDNETGGVQDTSSGKQADEN